MSAFNTPPSTLNSHLSTHLSALSTQLLLRTDLPSGHRPIAQRHMADFHQMVRLMLSRHRIRVRKWRVSMSGCAWQVRYRNGRVIRWIEAPRPRSALSLSIFLHEIGHHVVGFDQYKRRCEEEFHVWRWALDEMRRLKVTPDEKVLNRFDLSMRYAVGKAMRRGIKDLPKPLRQFLPEAA
ncbi:MAG TPA: hypothetical protein VFC78_06270 [Tepidisphaeraceae bacterium]|nr:hypothetical protein [Tepidisphaeraceae bacterium]